MEGIKSKNYMYFSNRKHDQPTLPDNTQERWTEWLQSIAPSLWTESAGKENKQIKLKAGIQAK